MPYSLLYAAYWVMLVPVWTVPVEILYLRSAFRGRLPVWQLVTRVALAIVITYFAVAALVALAFALCGLLGIPTASLWIIGMSPWDHASAKAAWSGAAFLLAVSHVARHIQIRTLNRLLRSCGYDGDVSSTVLKARRWSGVGRWGVVILQIALGR